LAITDNQGNALANLNSGAQGVFPSFKQAQYATVVVSDSPNHTYSWTVACSQLNPVVPWAANTYYTAGQAVINPSGDTVTAAFAHTSGTSYNSANWNLSPSYAPKGGLWYNVKDYGAKGDNATDDTAAIQSAYNAASTAGAFGAGLYFPPGNYVTSSVINVSVSMTIRGASSAATSIINKTGGAGIFTLNADRIVVQDIYFQCQGSISAVTTSQACGLVYATGNGGAIERCYFAGWYINIWFQACAQWFVKDNYISRAVQYNLKIQNTANGDNGDQVISGNFFAVGGSYTPAAHIRQESAGGVKLIGNKILQGAIGYDLAVADGVATSILEIVGNSLEYQTTSAIRLGLAGPSNTGTFAKILIGQNQITGQSCASPVIDVNPAVSGKLSAVRIAGPIISGTAGSTSFIHVANVDDVSIDGVHLSTGSAGITVDSTATNVYVGMTNKMQAVTTPVSNACPSPVLNQAYEGIVITPPSGGSSQSSLYIYNSGGVAVVTVANNGNALFAGGMRIGGAYQNTASLYVTPTNTYPGMLIKAAGGTVDLLQLQAQSTTAALFRLDQYGHIVADGNGSPTLAVQTAAGTGATASVTSGGSDTSGQITVTAGTSPASGALVNVTFANAYAVSPRSIQLTSSSGAAASGQAYISAKSTTGFTISLVNAPAASASLSWYYTVVG
jgi:hypothetical protein